MQDSEKMSPDEIRKVRDIASFVARRHNGEYEIWQKKGLSLLEKNGWKKETDKDATDPALIYVIGSGSGEKYVFVSERRGRSATYLIASQEGGLRTGIGAWHDVLAEIGVR